MPKLLTQGVSLEPKNGRQLIGIVAGFKSERWPVIDRNAGRLQLGIRIKGAKVCSVGLDHQPDAICCSNRHHIPTAFGSHKTVAGMNVTSSRISNMIPSSGMLSLRIASIGSFAID